MHILFLVSLTDCGFSDVFVPPSKDKSKEVKQNENGSYIREIFER